MLNITDEDKIKILKQAIIKFEAKEENYICPNILRRTRDLFPRLYIVGKTDLNDIIPELLKYKPEKTYSAFFWFNPSRRRKRIRLLKKVIKYINNKNK